jgi:hypothetical protein
VLKFQGEHFNKRDNFDIFVLSEYIIDKREKEKAKERYGVDGMMMMVSLTSPNLNISRNYASHAIRGHTPIHGVVDILSVCSGREGQQHERSVPQNSPDAADIADRCSVYRDPVNGWLRVAGAGAVEKAARRVRKLQLRWRLHDERGTSVMLGVAVGEAFLLRIKIIKFSLVFSSHSIPVAVCVC